MAFHFNEISTSFQAPCHLSNYVSLICGFDICTCEDIKNIYRLGKYFTHFEPSLLFILGFTLLFLSGNIGFITQFQDRLHIQIAAKSAEQNNCMCYHLCKLQDGVTWQCCEGLKLAVQIV